MEESTYNCTTQKSYSTPLIPTMTHFPKYKIFLSSVDSRNYFVFTEIAIVLKSHTSNEIIYRKKYPRDILEKRINQVTISKDENLALVSTSAGDLWLMSLRDDKTLLKVNENLDKGFNNLSPNVIGGKVENYKFTDHIIIQTQTAKPHEITTPVKKFMKVKSFYHKDLTNSLTKKPRFLIHQPTSDSSYPQLGIAKAYLWTEAGSLVIVQPCQSNSITRTLSILSLRGAKSGLRKIIINFKFEFEKQVFAQMTNFGDIIYADERFFVLLGFNYYCFAVDLVTRKVEKINMKGIIPESLISFLGVHRNINRDPRALEPVKEVFNNIPCLFKLFDEELWFFYPKRHRPAGFAYRRYSFDTLKFNPDQQEIYSVFEFQRTSFNGETVKIDIGAFGMNGLRNNDSLVLHTFGQNGDGYQRKICSDDNKIILLQGELPNGSLLLLRTRSFDQTGMGSSRMSQDIKFIDLKSNEKVNNLDLYETDELVKNSILYQNRDTRFTPMMFTFNLRTRGAPSPSGEEDEALRLDEAALKEVIKLPERVNSFGRGHVLCIYDLVSKQEYFMVIPVEETVTPLYQFDNGNLLAEVGYDGFGIFNPFENSVQKIADVGQLEEDADTIFLGVVKANEIEILENKETTNDMMVFLSICEDTQGIFLKILDSTTLEVVQLTKILQEVVHHFDQSRPEDEFYPIEVFKVDVQSKRIFHKRHGSIFIYHPLKKDPISMLVENVTLENYNEIVDISISKSKNQEGFSKFSLLLKRLSQEDRIMHHLPAYLAVEFEENLESSTTRNAKLKPINSQFFSSDDLILGNYTEDLSREVPVFKIINNNVIWNAITNQYLERDYSLSIQEMEQGSPKDQIDNFLSMGLEFFNADNVTKFDVINKLKASGTPYQRRIFDYLSSVLGI